MSRQPKPNPAAARAALISGKDESPPKESVQADFIILRTKVATRWLRLSAITQLIHDPGQLGGPWFVFDGQKTAVDQAQAIKIAAVLKISLP